MSSHLNKCTHVLECFPTLRYDRERNMRVVNGMREGDVVVVE